MFFNTIIENIIIEKSIVYEIFILYILYFILTYFDKQYLYFKPNTFIHRIKRFVTLILSYAKSEKSHYVKNCESKNVKDNCELNKLKKL